MFAMIILLAYTIRWLFEDAILSIKEKQAAREIEAPHSWTLVPYLAQPAREVAAHA